MSMISVSCVANDIVHIQTDKQNYIVGETIFLKAYILSDELTDGNSTTLVLELVGDSGYVKSSFTYPIFGSVAVGSIDLPEKFHQGIYFLHAYTKCAVGLKVENSFVKPLFIFNTEASSMDVHPKRRYGLKIYPQFVVANHENTVAVRVNDGNNLPAPAIISLVNAKNEVLQTFKTLDEGFAKFTFIPSASDQYYLSVLYPDSSTKRYDLSSKKEGILLRIENQETGKLLHMDAAGIKDSEPLTVLGLMDESSLFNHSFTLKSGRYTILVPTNQLPSGLLRILVVNKKKEILAAGSTIVVNHNTFLPLVARHDTSKIASDQKGEIVLQFPDSTVGSFSVSISDYGQEIHFPQQNIYSLLPGANQRSPSFTSAKVDFANQSSKENDFLDLLLKENISPIDSEKFLERNSKYCTPDTGYIRIQGKAYYKNKMKPINKGEVHFILSTKDSSTWIVTAPIGKDGSFSVNKLVYYDTATIRYSLTGRPHDEIKIHLDSVEAKRTQNIFSEISAYPTDYSIFYTDTLRRRLIQQYNFSKVSAVKSDTLKEVVVTAKLSPTERTNNKYAKGLFNNSNMARIVDLVNFPAAIHSGNILDYIQGRIPGLFVSKAGSDYVLTSQRRASLFNQPNIRTYLNEQEISISVIASIPLDEIALVKYFPPGASALSGIGSAGVLAVYTKKIEDRAFEGMAELEKFTYPGYSSYREFPTDINFTSTLYWNPNIFLDGSTSIFRIDFKNSIGAKKLHLIVEGVTNDGKLVHLDQIFSGQ